MQGSDGAAAEDDADPLDDAAALLDEGHGPAFFTDFCKALLHPRSVVEVPTLQLPTAPSPGFGDLASCGAAAQEVRCAHPRVAQCFQPPLLRAQAPHML